MTTSLQNSLLCCATGRQCTTRLIREHTILLKTKDSKLIIITNNKGQRLMTESSHQYKREGRFKNKILGDGIDGFCR